MADLDQVLAAIADVAGRLEAIERRLAPGHVMTSDDAALLRLIDARIGRIAFSSADLRRHLGDALDGHDLTDLRKIGRRLGAIARRHPIGALRLVAAGRASGEGRLFQITLADDGDDLIVHRPRPS